MKRLFTDSSEHLHSLAQAAKKAITGRPALAGLRAAVNAGREWPWPAIGLAVPGLLLACAMRWALLGFKSADYYASLKPWYNTLVDQGFSAFGTAFSTYNPPYLYALYIIARALPDLPAIIAVKIPGLVADFICAGFVYLIVEARIPKSRVPAWSAALAVLFFPTVILNSAFWGQADSVFAAGLLGCVYFLMKKKPVWAMAAFGISLSVKLQAVFLAPVLLALVLDGSIPVWSTLIVPAILFLAMIPAWWAGRPLGDLIGVYAYQASQFEFITMSAASGFALVPGSKRVFNLLYTPGIITGVIAAFMWWLVIQKRRRELNASMITELALVAALVVPFFLPKMHERYFYAADVLSVAFAFLYPRMFFVPLLIGGVSFLSYQPFLFERALIPLPILALVLLGVIAILFRHAIGQLYGPELPPPQTNPRGAQEPSASAKAELGTVK
jgi:Gpi18-like mannosyltransferase